MPELPEVESLARSLRPLRGRRITAVDVRLPVSVRTHAPAPFRRALTGRQVQSAERMGKALLLRLSGERTLVVHFKLWGLLRYHPQRSEGDGQTAALLHLDRGTLEFRELQLSTIELHDDARLGAVPYLAKLGVDPLSRAFTRERFTHMLSGRSPLRAVLTDQERLAGVGNLWALEILHAARLRPDRRADSLSAREVRALYTATGRVLRRAVERGGEPEFMNARGRPGRARLAVYDRVGERCPRGDGTVVAGRVAGRPSFYCPGCQR